MGRGLMGLHGWGRCGSFLAAFAVMFLIQADHAQLAAADAATATPTADSAPAGTVAERIKAALMKYDDETFLALLSQNPEAVDFVYAYEESLLNSAAYMGNLLAVEALIHQGADPNLSDKSPLMEALFGASTDSDFRRQLVPDHGNAPDIPRSTFYEVIATLLKAGANYQFLAVAKPFTVGPWPSEPWSFVEGLIMEVCEPEYFSADHLVPFRDADIRFHVDRELLRNMKNIRSMGKIGIKEPSCVSFFDSRIVSMNKA